MDKRNSGVTPLKQRLEYMRWKTGAWEELRWRAKAYHGRRWVHGRVAASRLSREPRILAEMQTADATRDQRRRRMVEVCTQQVEKYKQKLRKAEEHAAKDGDELEKEMRKVVGQQRMGGIVHAIFERMGGVVHAIFEVVAKTKRHRSRESR